MHNQSIKPIVLAILDGWGHSTDKHGNAIRLASTPHIDRIWKEHANTLLNASGTHVGLPKKQMGNSEVGHTTIGAGRVINQDLVRISRSIKDRTFFENKILHNICSKISSQKSQIHLIGLCSDGGVHSHIDHLVALIDFVQNYKIPTCIHIITDGRDTNPRICKTFIQKIHDIICNIDYINICTISGRYYSMDRDCRWSRTEKAYNILINDKVHVSHDFNRVIDNCYKENIFDEFITPTRIYEGNISNNDGIIFFNFRPDRIRQLLHCFASNSFKGFPTEKISNLSVATFTQYDSNLCTPIAFPPEEHKNFLGEVLSREGLRQFRLAETEKYAHVTYFFNGGVEEPFPGEDRELISSPKVDTYDLDPKMSAYQVTDSIITALKKNEYHFIVINYANPDMVGHTGNLKATIEAVEVIDQCIHKLVQETMEINGILIITADHGNADYMLDQNNKPCTSHSTNPVPFIIITNDSFQHPFKLRNKGSLADIAPTILDLFRINTPQDMSGRSLIETSTTKHQ